MRNRLRNTNKLCSPFKILRVFFSLEILARCSANLILASSSILADQNKSRKQ